MLGRLMQDLPDNLLQLVLQALIFVIFIQTFNACCQALVNNNLLKQRNSCNGRLQVERRVSYLFKHDVTIFQFIVVLA